MARGKQHNKQFKLDAVAYRKEHPDLTQEECAKNLGIGISTLAHWESQFRNYDGDIQKKTASRHNFKNLSAHRCPPHMFNMLTDVLLSVGIHSTLSIRLYSLSNLTGIGIKLTVLTVENS